MDIKHVAGKNKGKVMLYALSTCGWCKKTKKLFDSLGIEYHYVDVDLVEDAEKESVRKEVMRWNPRGSFPTIVINDKICIVGYDEQKFNEVIGK
ncbi:MAG: glutaredoxin family protein [Candidatus Zixiibacteriota bacterium]